MKSPEEKLSSINSKSVWKFPKQETDFEEVFKATLLFDEIPSGGEINFENYFIKNHDKYNIGTDRHRIWSTAQMYGLLTKTEFYVRKNYSIESTTPIFNKMKHCKIGSVEYNTLKTEQILKIKMKAITEISHACDGWNVLAVLYSYMVLKALKDRGIPEVPIDRFMTYVMTSRGYGDLSDTVYYLSTRSEPSKYVEDYKSISRFLNVLENIRLFVIDHNSDTIYINPIFDDYFQEKFVLTHNIDDLSKNLDDERQYSFFLNTCQSFGIDLIDSPSPRGDEEYTTADSTTDPTEEDQKIILDEIEKKIDEPFTPDNIDKILDSISEETASKPVNERIKIAKTLVRNPKYALLVKMRAQYKCEICGVEGFIKKDGTKYAEAHHVMELAKTHTDNPHQMICVCPTCHRIIHYGAPEELEKRKALNTQSES